MSYAMQQPFECLCVVIGLSVVVHRVLWPRESPEHFKCLSVDAVREVLKAIGRWCRQMCASREPCNPEPHCDVYYRHYEAVKDVDAILQGNEEVTWADKRRFTRAISKDGELKRAHKLLLESGFVPAFDYYEQIARRTGVQTWYFSLSYVLAALHFLCAVSEACSRAYKQHEDTRDRKAIKHYFRETWKDIDRAVTDIEDVTDLEAVFHRQLPSRKLPK